MPRHLYIHCGPPKTGTSAIQAILRDAAPSDLTYPASGQWPDGAHHKVMYALDGVTRRGDIEIPSWDTVSAALVTEIEAAPGDVLISSEHIRPTNLPRLLDGILPRLSSGFEAIQPIVVLRHPLERAASAYNQSVKDAVTAEARLPDEYLVETGPGFRLGPLIRKWSQGPYPARFLSFHPPATLVHRFLALIGHETPATEGRRRNASISGYGLATLLAAHRMQLSAADRARVFDGLRADPGRKIWAGASFPFSARATRRFLDRVVAADLDRVQRRTGIDLTHLHPDPPDRFTLNAKDSAALRAHFNGFPLTPNQQHELNRVVRTFHRRRGGTATARDGAQDGTLDDDPAER